MFSFTICDTHSRQRRHCQAVFFRPNHCFSDQLPSRRVNPETKPSELFKPSEFFLPKYPADASVRESARQLIRSVDFGGGDGTSRGTVRERDAEGDQVDGVLLKRRTPSPREGTGKSR